LSLPTTTKATIYGIKDDDDGLFRWIGRTTHPLRRRLYGHKCTPDGAMYEWLKGAWGHVSIQELGVGDAKAEKELILRLHKAGHPLLNKAHLHGWPRSQSAKQSVLKNRLCR
jgi:hypothetical protein